MKSSFSFSILFSLFAIIMNLSAMEQGQLTIVTPKVIIGSVKNSTQQTLRLAYQDENEKEVNRILIPGQVLTKFVPFKLSYWNPSNLTVWKATANIYGNEAKLLNSLLFKFIYIKNANSLTIVARMVNPSEKAESYEFKQPWKSNITKQEYVINVELKGEEAEDSIVDVVATMQ